MKKLFCIILIASVIFCASCRANYTPVVATPEPAPPPTEPPFDPSEHTLGICGAPELMTYGFLKACEELSYNCVCFGYEDIDEALEWAKENKENCGLAIFGADEEKRAAINETAAYGCQIITAFFEGDKPRGAKLDISLPSENAGRECASMMFEALAERNGAVLICAAEGSESQKAAENAFRARWAELAASHEKAENSPDEADANASENEKNGDEKAEAEDNEESAETELMNIEYLGADERSAGIAKSILERKSGIIGIFACDAKCAEIFSQAVSELEEKPAIVCAEASEENLALVKSGEILGAYIAPYDKLGEYAAQALDALLRGEDAGANIVEGSMVTASKTDVINEYTEVFKNARQTA